MPQIYTQYNFDMEVLQSKIPVLVDFWAEWCTPCHRFTPIIEKMEKMAAGEYKVGCVDVDKEQKLVERYNITIIPTIIVFKNGQSTAQLVGAVSEEDLRHMMVND
ncbi:thioredoxin [Pectinatus frisingensis]|jgi:thioredoxin 1|uniref:thioredoxin n=1 Tax=Pectinatus frisingensis TaxID=865 RepID=UPI0018C48BE4|nr:thioredoxin [Pectinatus frisingensis]